MPIANFLPTNADYARFLPELILTLAGILIMFMEALRPEGRRTNAGVVAILALVLALPAALLATDGPAFQGMLVIDGMGTFFRTLVIVVGLLVVFSSTDYLRRENQESGEYYALILFSIVGQCVMVTANELVMIFIGLEISSIASYILAGYLRDDARNNESALKYFLLGSFATAFLLYGVAWMYGATGSTNLTEIREVADLGRRAAGSADRRGRRADFRRTGLQDFGRSVPGLGPGRLSGRARAGLGVSDRGTESRRLRGSAAHLPRESRTDRLPLGARDMGLRAGDHGGRELRRDHAIEYQAPAGLQLHRARGLCVGCGSSQLRNGFGSRHVLPGGVRVHQHRSVRGSDLHFPQGRAIRRHRRFRGARPAPAGAWLRC